MMKYIFCLTGIKGKAVLLFLIKNKNIEKERIVVFSYQDPNTKERTFDEIAEMCRGIIEFHDYSREKSLLTAMSNTESNLIFAIGWQFIIRSTAIQDERLIVFHDSLLPKYRGFNPLVTALVNGDREIGVTAIIANEQVDAGDIIGQKSIDINYPIKIQKAIEMMSALYVDLLNEIFTRLSSGTIVKIKQNEKNASFSIWRDEQDYFIDWSNSADSISRFVDATGDPYKGARTRIDNAVLVINDSTLLPDQDIVNRTPGKLINIGENYADVICGTGMLRIYNVTDLSGNPYIFKILRKRLY